MRSLRATLAAACVASAVSQCKFWFEDEGVEFDLSSLQAASPFTFQAGGVQTYVYSICQNITGVSCPPDGSGVVSMIQKGDAGCLVPLGQLPNPQASLYGGGSGMTLTYAGGQQCSQFGQIPTTSFTLMCATGPPTVYDFRIIVPDCQVAYTIKTPAGCSYAKTRMITPLGAGWIAFSVILSLLLLYFVGGAAYKRYKYGASGLEAIPNIDTWRACGRGIARVCTCGRAAAKPGAVEIDDMYYEPAA